MDSMQLTSEQVALRRTGITSTDISAIVGLNPYRSALEVYLDKVARPIEHEDTEGQWWGTALEPLIALRYMELTGAMVILNHETFRLAGTICLATPDGFARRDGADGLFEAKEAVSYPQVQRWGDGSDECPEEYLVQDQWAMMVLAKPWCDMAVKLAGYHGTEFRIYRLLADPTLQSELCKRADFFENEYVLKQVPPPPDGSDSALSALRALYPDVVSDIRLADSATADLLDQLEGLSQDKADAETEYEVVRQKLIAAVGDAEGVCDTMGRRFTGKADKNGKRIYRFKPKKGT
jgi:putative phage-type endonuclease